VAQALEPGAVAVTYLRYQRQFEQDPQTGKTPPSSDSALAFVVSRSGEVKYVELGSAAEIEGLVQGWRAALGKPLDGRGVAATTTASAAETLEDLGRRLRERVLDPVLTHAGDVHTLHVVVDDVLHLVPLDALPFEGGLPGERIAVHTEVSLARILRAAPADTHESTLTLLGGIDYDAEIEADEAVTLDVQSPPLVTDAQRSGPKTAFTFLPGTSACRTCPSPATSRQGPRSRCERARLRAATRWWECRSRPAAATFSSRWRRVGPGGYPPGPPTDPDVRD
jgi:hypothetical protein